MYEHVQRWAEQTLGLCGDGDGLRGGRCGAVQGPHGEHWALSCSSSQVHGAQQESGSIPARARVITAPVTENGFLD